MLQRARNPLAIRSFVLTTSGLLTSDSGGELKGIFSMDPSSSSNWSQLAVLYDQFRVIGGQLKLASYTGNGASTASNSICAFVFDNDSSSTPSSIGDIAGYSEITYLPTLWTDGTIRTMNFKRPIIRGVVQGQQLWYNETSPGSSPGSLKYYATNLSGSTTYYSYVLEYLVEFQMRSS